MSESTREIEALRLFEYVLSELDKANVPVCHTGVNFDMSVTERLGYHLERLKSQPETLKAELHHTRHERNMLRAQLDYATMLLKSTINDRQ